MFANIIERALALKGERKTTAVPAEENACQESGRIAEAYVAADANRTRDAAGSASHDHAEETWLTRP
jgi:hypothetical protein